MLTTGLLSLNIHEALTLDGTELCLHPDIFVTESSGGPSNGSQQTRLTHAKSASSDDNAANKGGIGGASTVSGGTATNSQQSSSPASPPGLSVGDMIEIRVWDPLPKEGPTKSPGSSYMRKNLLQSPPAPSISLNSAAASSVQVEFPAANTFTQSSSNLRPRLSSMANSLQYSESSDVFLSPDNDNDINDAFTTASSHEKDRSVEQEAESAGATTASGDGGHHPTPPTKTVVATISNSNFTPTTGPSSQLPPVFPRARANTSEISKPPKPLHRRVPSLQGILGSSSSQVRSPKPFSRHNRQMSDMTVETQQPDIRDMQTMESNDDDATDDTWSKLSTTHTLRLSFVLLVTEKMLTTLKGNTRTQISMLRQIADLYSLSSYDMVTIHKIEPQDEEEVLKIVSADFVLVTIKDQFISRGDMHFFQMALQGSWIYEGQRLNETSRGIKAHAREIRHGNHLAKSGIVTDKTMITFRSRSARIIWLVQLSSEMWDYTSPYEHTDQPESICEIYFDQWIRFIYKLFTKWKELEVSYSSSWQTLPATETGLPFVCYTFDMFLTSSFSCFQVTHSLTVVFFSRTFLSNGQKSSLKCRDVYGRSYEVCLFPCE
jgi:hypothetical protein